MKKLIFIPYHDTDYFRNSRIMTREYALLKIFMDTDVFDLYTVSKPRTFLDRKKVSKDTIFPEDSVEKEIMNHLDSAESIEIYKTFDWRIVTKKRGWWVKGYEEASLKLAPFIDSNTYVYSNNPFAYKLILECKKKGAKVLFDMMDNFAKHPSLNDFEKKCAYEGYDKLIQSSDFYCCNSVETQKFCEENFSIKPLLIKNGVFPNTSKYKKNSSREKLKKILENYDKSVGYIGKLGTRIDENLVDALAKNLPDTVFTYIGPHLKGQKNTRLVNVFNEHNNIIEFGPVSSSEIYSYLDIFDILIIPHAVGENENGGDPLKLYQYLNTQKKIISTKIIGVEEFENIIAVTNDYQEWIDEIENYNKDDFSIYDTPITIFWEHRAHSLIEYILNSSK